jgi:hypothetical protein
MRFAGLGSEAGFPRTVEQKSTPPIGANGEFAIREA